MDVSDVGYDANVNDVYRQAEEEPLEGATGYCEEQAGREEEEIGGSVERAGSVGGLCNSSPISTRCIRQTCIPACCCNCWQAVKSMGCSYMNTIRKVEKLHTGVYANFTAQAKPSRQDVVVLLWITVDAP